MPERIDSAARANEAARRVPAPDSVPALVTTSEAAKDDETSTTAAEPEVIKKGKADSKDELRVSRITSSITDDSCVMLLASPILRAQRSILSW